MQKFFIIFFIFSIISIQAEHQEHKVNLTIDPDFPDIRIASLSIFAPGGFFFETFTSHIDAKMEVRPSHGNKFSLLVKKGQTYSINRLFYGGFGWVILNFALLECKAVKSPGTYYIGDVKGEKKKFPMTMTKLTQKKSFPQDWVGVYKGELVRHTTKGIIGKVKMELHIQTTPNPNRWTWKIIYDGQPRNYELATIDSVNGIYVIDEKNSILLYSFFVGGELITHFGAQFGYLLTRYRLKGDKLFFSTTTSNARPYSTSGGQGNIPVINSFEVREWQNAQLTRVTNK